MTQEEGTENEQPLEEKVEKEEVGSAEEETTEEQEEGAEDNAEEDKESSEESTEEQDSEELAKPSKRSASETIRGLKAERNAERQERERLIAERATLAAQLEIERSRQQHAVSTEQRKAEEQRLALLDPQERQLYEANQKMRQLEYKLNQLEIQRQDDRDRAEFHAKAAHDPMYSKYHDEIEQTYQDGLRKGVAAPREDLLAWRLGKELLKDRTAKASQKKEAAGKRIDSVTAKPASAKGDVAGARKGKSEEDRLRGVQI